MDPILVGYVRRAHGINGAVVVRPLTDDVEHRWAEGAVLHSDSEPPVAYTIAEANPYRGDLLVLFEEVRSRTDADALKGTSFTIDTTDRRDLDEGEFWAEDLVGCAVVNDAGGPIGVVEKVEFGEAQDRLVVRTGSGLVDVPFVDAIVPVVDLDRRVVVVTPPLGLFEPS